MIRINFYVYEWFNVDTGEVFYIGKGTKSRYKTTKDRNAYFNNYINKYNCKSRIVYKNLNEDEAYKKEIETILHYKKLGLAKCNLTNGGEDPPTTYGKNNPSSRAVIQLSLEGDFIKEFDCITDASKSINTSESSISSCCKGHYGRKSYGGFLWLYKEDYNINKKYTYNPDNNSRIVIQYDINGNYIKEWASAKMIHEKLGYKRSGICGCCKKYYNSSNGYVWRYKDDVEDHKSIIVAKKNSPVAVVQLDINDTYVNRYKNCSEAAKIIGMKSNGHIIACCNKKGKTAFGYKWIFEHEYNKIERVTKVTPGGDDEWQVS